MRFLRAVTILSLLWLAADPVTARAQVRGWEGTIELPTYLLGAEDPNPPFPLVNPHRIYPYTMLDDLTDRREVKKYKTLNLENEYLKAIVLPEMGGRLYSLFDKVNKREVFYRNNVVKYGLVGLRGAWISGGIEWNFPDGHSTLTVSPVASAIRKNPDGGATITVGDIDRVSGMHWEVALTLRPGEARLRQDVTLFNATPLTNLYWFWATAAVPASDDMQFIYPMREAYPHTKGVVWSYPMHDGIDWSWYKNVREPTSLFARQSRRTFFGAYYHESDYGVVHVADFRDVPGKKTWTWGVADDGLIWTNLLTDNDGPYNEIQAGRYETQLNYEFMPPRRVERFTEYWYPVRGLGEGFVEATDRLALNVNFVPAGGKRESRVEIGISPVTAIATPEVRVFLGSNVLRNESPRSLVPLTALKFGVPVDDLEAARRGLAIQIRSAGQLIARWSAAEPIDGNPDFVPAAGRAAPPPKSSQQMSVEELFLRGVEQEKDGHENAAAATYLQVLDRDAGYVPALLKLAWRDYRAADFQSAEGYLARALARDGTSPQTHYVAGVVYRAAQRWGLAQDALWAAIHYGGPAAPAYAQLGEIAIHEKRYDEAASLLRQSLSFNPEDCLVLADLAVALRLAGKTAEATKAVDQALERMPLLPFALTEKARLTASTASGAGARWKRIFGYDVQNYLEAVAWYRRLDDQPSIDYVLQAAIKDFSADSLSPLVYYYLASNERQKGNTAEAQKYAELAAAGPCEKVFPHRLEDALVLDEAIRENPTDARAHYYLGNFLFARGRYDDAARLWVQALGLGFEYSVLHRNLGVHAWRVKKNLQDAAGFLAIAIDLAPDDYRLYVDADEILTQLADTARREKLFASAPVAVLGRDTVRVRRAMLLVQQKQFQSALDLLKEHRFKPWEGGVGVRQVYVACNLEQGRAALAAGRPVEAVEAFRRAAEYPENLGVGKPNEPHDEEAFYWLGEALRTAGNADAAREAWQQAAKGGRHISPPERAFQAAALGKLGRGEESQKVFARLMEALSAERPGATAFYAAGLTELLGGRSEQASHYFRRSLEIDPGFWPARLELER
jgi:tetratricopeptide (TPR) repeat protein